MHPAQAAPTLSATGSVERIEHAGRELYLVGTAHVSRESVLEVERVIEQVRPDTVCVELDPERYQALTDESDWLRVDLFTVIRQNKVLLLLARTVLSAYQKKLGARLGVRPGSELLAAVRAGERVGATIVLADRPLETTLKRTWARLSWWNRIKLGTSLFLAPFAIEEITEQQVEELKHRDNISELLAQLAQAVPELKQPLIDERDQYLASSVERAPGQKLVVVVGAGHVQGIIAQLGQPVDRAELERLPPRSRLGRVVAWGIPVLFLLALGWGQWKAPPGTLREMLLAWVLPSALSTALFTLAAGAKLVTVLAGALAAPITLLHPTIGVGMVTGLLEAWLRRPTVADCQNLSEDVLTWRGLYRNAVTRVLLVVILSGLGAILGGLVGAGWVAHLARPPG